MTLVPGSRSAAGNHRQDGWGRRYKAFRRRNLYIETIS
jgi:hypothetical protein